MIKKLTIIIPAYNEENTIEHVLSKVTGIALIHQIEK